MVLGSAAAGARLRTAQSKLPLSFERNDGQTQRRVKYLARAGGVSLFLTPDEAVFGFNKATRKPIVAVAAMPHGSFKPGAESLMTLPRPEPASALRMSFVGARPKAIEGVDRLPGLDSYFIGSDPSKWHRAIPTYAKVKYRNLYPGIDLVYYGNDHELECDLLVAPGASTKAVEFAFEGSDRFEIDSHGDLLLGTPAGRLVMHKPVAYQQKAGGGVEQVAGAYKRVGGTRVAVEVGPYDRSKPLVIDPAFVYATYLGGSTSDGASSVAVDPNGNAYLTGFTCSTNFPIIPPSAVQPFPGGTCNAFVTKLNATGTAFLYSTFLGGVGPDQGNGIAVDQAGFAYVTGVTSGNFPITAGAAQINAGGPPTDAFIAKLSGDGTRLIFSTYLGGGALDVGTGIAIPAGCPGACDAFVSGYTTSTDFPATPGAAQTFNGGAGGDLFDAFAARLSASGARFKYAT
jgi:hypothetical protein